MAFEETKQAYRRINDFIHKTLVKTSSTLNDKTGRQIFMKCELFQKTGSFKVRGALNAVSLG